MVERIKNYIITDYKTIIIALVLFVLVFILPQFTDAESFALDLIRFTIIGIAGTIILKKILQFKKENPDFKPSESKTAVDTAGSLIAIFSGLLFGLIFMIVVAIFSDNIAIGDAFGGFATILIGGFNAGFTSFGSMIYYAVPIILTGLSVAFAFRTGLFNIGSTGQLTIGAYVAVHIGIKWGFLGDIFPLLHWGTAVLAAMIVGGIWGSIPGLLKAYRNVNEVVASIMLNYVSMYLVILLINRNIFNSNNGRTINILPTAETPTFNLEYLFPGSSINGGIIVAIIVVIILHIILNKTTFGYELKAVGFNRNASKYAGMNEKRNIVYSMVISGAISGLAGAMIFLVLGKNMAPVDELLMEGFTGIAISLLGLSSPFGVLFAGVFYSSLQQGGFYLQLYSYTPEIVDIIIAVIIYASALGLFLQKFVIKRFKKIEAKEPLPEDVVEGSDS